MRRYRAELIIGLVLVAAVLVGFGPALDNDFVSFDDPLYVSRNSEVLAGLSGRGLSWAWTSYQATNWHPLTWLSLQADATLFGTGPRGFHRTNLLLHAANAVLLFLALRVLTGAVWRSGFVAALFAAHPLRVESVAWVSERKDVLCAFFFMLTLLAYAWYARRPGLVSYLAVLLAFALGLLAKPMLVTLPFVLLLLDFWPLRRWGVPRPVTAGKKTPPAPPAVRRPPWVGLLLEKLPLLGLVAVSCYFTWQAQRATAEPPGAFPMGLRLANALVAYATYLGKTVWPINLAAMYLYPGRGIPAWQWAGAALLLVALTVLALAAWRRRPYLGVGWLWYLGMLVPVIGLVQVGRQAMADRYTYLPSIGLYLAAVWGVAELAVGRARTVVVASAGGLLALALLLTWGQVHYWTNDITLWEHALEATGPDNAFAHISLGESLAERGDTEQAMQHFKEALRAMPGNAEAYADIGQLLASQHDFDGAIRNLSLAVRLDPSHAALRNNLGAALYEQGKTAEAAEQFRAALARNPNYAQAWYNLGLALQGQPDKTAEARDGFRRAVQLEPARASYRCSLAHALSRTGQPDAAAEQYREATRLAPNWLSNYDQEAAVRATAPDERLRNGRRAVDLAEQVCDATGYRQPHFLDTLAAAYAEAGNFDAAVKTARKALELASTGGPSGLADGLRQRIEQYEAHKPCRDASFPQRP
jgi:tetratricopeptide (TPR) repeat protein